jgi:hypothetical protein
VSARALCDGAADAAWWLLTPGVSLGRMVSSVARQCWAPGDACACGGSHDRCGCEIPPPCWVPRRLEDVRQRACAGNTAVVQVRLTNAGDVQRSYDIHASDPAAVIEPQVVTLGPLEHALVAVSLKLPSTAVEGTLEQCVITLEGCRSYRFLWTIEVECDGRAHRHCHHDHHHHRREHCWPHRRRGCECCTKVDVQDRPDYVHHWYDHFYCDRPCLHG